MLNVYYANFFVISAIEPIAFLSNTFNMTYACSGSNQSHCINITNVELIEQALISSLKDSFSIHCNNSIECEAVDVNVAFNWDALGWDVSFDPHMFTFDGRPHTERFNTVQLGIVSDVASGSYDISSHNIIAVDATFDNSTTDVHCGVGAMYYFGTCGKSLMIS